MATPADWIEVTDWKGRDGVHATRPDPYVIWAQLTAWADYPSAVWTPPPLPWHCRLIRWMLGLVGLVDQLSPCRPSTTAVRRAVIIELDSADNLAGFFMQAAKTPDDIQIAPLYGLALAEKPPGYAKFLTAFVTADGLRLLAQVALGEHVVRFDLCEHIEPGRPNVSVLRLGPTGPIDPPELEGKQLLGIIDDGCPFAHRSFLTSSGGQLSSRFAVLWDQNQIAAAFSSSAAEKTTYGSSPWVFINGWEIRRRYPPKPAADGGLDHWLTRFRDSATGSLDEDACYDLADYHAMKRRIVHGPHVADIAAGPLRWRQTIYTDRDTPPGQDPIPFNRKDSAADRTVTDIAWVQLPRGGLQDSSGGWLDSHVLDGLRYLLWCRGKDTSKTVVSLSYGTTVGPHDGSSILAQAIDAIVIGETMGAPDALHVVIAGGNSFDAKGHALVKLQPGEERGLVWRVLPGSEAPSFLQLWLPDNTWIVSLERPDGVKTAPMTVGTVQLAPDANAPNAAVVYLERSSRGDGPMVLIALAPTAGEGHGGRPPAPHGDWLVTLRAGSAGVARAYIARNDLDMDAVLRGRQSIFVDPPDSPAPELRAPFDDPGKNGDDDRLFGSGRGNTVLRRRGTLNAIGSAMRAEVVAGHARNFSDAAGDRTHSRYSSAGPGAGDVGRNPLTSYPTDESGVLRGVRAAGSRSGSVFRLVGTSTAAPQLARWLLSEPDQASKSPPPSAPGLDEALYGDDGGRPASVPF